jgi:hypothetical protein
MSSNADAGARGPTSGGHTSAGWTPAPCGAKAPWFDLAYPVATAAYSRAIDALIIVPTNDPSLRIVNPETCAESIVPLPRLGGSLALSPSGAIAAVGHDGSVSLVDLELHTVKGTYAIARPESDVTIDDQGNVQVYTHAARGVTAALLTVDGADGSVRTFAPPFDAGGHVRMTPDGRSLYRYSDDGTSADDIDQIDLTTGMSRSVAKGACLNLFPTDDSTSLVTGCATVLGVSATGLSFRSKLEGVSLLQHADTSTAHGVVVSLGRQDILGSPNGADVAGFVRVHDAGSFKLLKTIDLPPLRDGDMTGPPIGRFVFIRSDGLKYYVVARRGGPEWGPLADGVAILDADQAAGSTQPAWQVPSPPRYDEPLTSISVARTTALLSFEVQDAAYSAPLNRIVATSTQPTSAVLLVDPDSGTSQTIATPAGPSKVSLSPDGLTAAVVRSGGVTFLNLQTRAVLREQDGAATDVAFGPPGSALLATANGLSWLDLGTGATREAFGASASAFGFGTLAGTLTFYTSSAAFGPELIRHDDVATNVDPVANLGIFSFDDNNVTPTCGSRLWVAEDGGDVILNCGRVYRQTTPTSDDLVYAYGFENTFSITDVVHSSTMGRYFMAPELLFQGDTYFDAFPYVTVYDDELLNLRATIAVGSFPGPSTPGVTVQSRVQRVFLASKPERLYVVVHADRSEPPTNAVYTLDVSGL